MNTNFESTHYSETLERPDFGRSAFLSSHFLKRYLARSRRLDGLFRGLTFLSAASILVLLALILIALVQGSWPAIQKFGFNFILQSKWDPVAGEFGALVPIYGTIVTSFIALAIAVPVSFGIALFLTEIAPAALVGPLGVAIELLAAVPSVIYGMWGLFFFAPFLAEHVLPLVNKTLGRVPFLSDYFSGPNIGIGMLPASIILSVMIIPFISSMMRDVFQLVPSMLKESAYGLGATTWEVVWNVVLPESKLGVLAGVILGLGRALGETMAVTFIIGNSHEFSRSLLNPSSTISSTMANEFSEAVGELYTSSLVELGLILFLITFCVLAISKFLMLRLQSRLGGAR